MKKALIYLDDYHERTYVEMILKKTGWDVISISSDVGLSNTIMSFQPSVFLISQKIKGKDVSSVAMKVKKRKGLPKILVIGTNKPNKEEMKLIGVNSFIQSPIEPKIFFSILEKFGGPPAKEAFQKLKRAMLIDKEATELEKSNKAASKEGLRPTLERAFEDVKRKEHYEKILSQTATPPVTTSYKAKEIDNYIEDIRDLRKKEDEELDKKKKDFVKALFEASKKSST